jgi:hypothetical protein
MEALSVKTVGREVDLFHQFCLIVELEIIQNNLWLYVNANRFNSMYMEKN